MTSDAGIELDQNEIDHLERALVQAIIDENTTPDAYVLSQRFWNLLAECGSRDDITLRAASQVLVDGEWQEKP